MASRKRPADGERAAMVGYKAQYTIAADLIYCALLEGTLEWFRVADPEAGQVDDIQISSEGRLDAFQVKWAENTENISFTDLTKEDQTRSGEQRPSLVRQLADGWDRLSRAYPDRQVHVHLISRHIPSTRARIPHGEPAPDQPHFQGFLRDCWSNRTWVVHGLGNAPACWRPVLDALQKASQLDQPRFLEFLRACEFRFNYRLPEVDTLGGRDSRQRVEDIDRLTILFLDMAGGERRTVQLDRDEILKRLGWETRFKARFSHEFPIDDLYQPIKATVADLDESLHQLNRGYLALIGTPGSGKSTTLTHTLRYKKGYRLVRYYAFVPDSPFQGRGEASHFLHDVCLALQRQGFHGEQPRSQPTTREGYQELLSEQLTQIHRKWAEDGILTLILVDGLDHIEREQTPERSLLADLPHPDSIPKGVLFILGTQTLELKGLSPAIKVHLREQGRTLAIKPLDREAVFAMLDDANFPIHLTAAQKEEVFRLSDGHPLALIYLVQRLCLAVGEEQLQGLLAETDPYRGHIEQSYELYWQKLESNRALVELFALIARMRVPPNPKALVDWVEEATVAEFLKQAQHYFRKETDTRWHFFHNSFRQFILDKTSRDLFGDYDDKRHRDYHRKLADYAAASGTDLSWTWEEIYHCAYADDWDAVLKLGQQDRFRQQFFTLRPLEAIREDITLVLRAARARQDALVIIRCLLIEHELGERQFTLDQIDLPGLLLAVKGVEAARDYALDGRHLRISAIEALHLCAHLMDARARETARMIFNAAEPLELLSGANRISATDTEGSDLDRLEAWARVAHHFRPLDQIFTAISQLRVDINKDHAWEAVDSEREVEPVHDLALNALIDEVFESGDSTQLDALVSHLQSREDAEKWLIYLDFQTCLRRSPEDSTGQALDRLLEWAQTAELDKDDRLLIAEFLLRIRNDREEAARWIEGIGQPPLYQWGKFRHHRKNLSPFSWRIRLNRLLAALGRAMEPTVAVPSSEEPQHQGTVLFERHLVIIANLWGRAWAGDVWTPSAVVSELRSALRLFRRDFLEARDWYGWYELESAAQDFFRFAIQAAATHGMAAVQALSKAFEERWAKDKGFWSVDWRQEISIALYEADDLRERLVNRLACIETEIGADNDIQSRINNYQRLTRAWIKLGETERAQKLLPKILQDTFGIYHDKDTQFSRWMEWLQRINSTFPGTTVEDVRQFAAVLVSLEQSNRGRDIQDAAIDLVKLVATWKPAYSLPLVEWLFDRHALHYTSAVNGLLLAALQDDDPPIEAIFAVARHLLIPFAAGVLPELAETLAARCHEVRSAQQAENLLADLARTIEIRAFPSIRLDWWKNLLIGLRKVGGEESEFSKRLPTTPTKRDGAGQPALTLKTGEILTTEDAQLRVRSYRELLSLIDTVESTEHFRWDSLVRPLAKGLTREQIYQLRESLSFFQPGYRVEALFAERLYALGFTEEALQIVEPLVNETRPQGWDRWFDGGSRQVILRALVTINPEVWRQRAIECLVDDYLADYRYPSNLLANLEDLSEILFEVPPLKALWEEIREHVYQLSDFADPKELPPDLDLTPDPTTSYEMLAYFSFRAADIPIPEIREMAHRTLCRMVLDRLGDNPLQLELANFLGDKGIRPIQALAVLESVYPERPDFIGSFADQLSVLCASPDFVVRRMALGLVRPLAIEPEQVSDDRRRLPSIFKLELPSLQNTEEAVPTHVLKPGEVFPDTHDPLEMVQPFKSDLTLLYKLTGLPLPNLLARTTALKRALAPEKEWNKAAEEKLRIWLRAMKLEITYHRPRPQVALLAISYLVAELLDAGRLDSRSQNFLEGWFRRHDSALSLREPIARLECIHMPSPRIMGPYPDTAWVEKGAEAIEVFVPILANGFVVLGELTCIRSLDWKTPTEYRFSMVCHPDWPTPGQIDSADQFFPWCSDWNVCDYPKLSGADEPSTVIYGRPYQVDWGGGNWLALNPSLALALGWQLASEGLFRWIDSNGELMAESLWWMDGPIDRSPPRIDEVCGEGWLVIATNRAVDIISRAVGQAKWVGAVLRQYRGDDGQLVHRFATSRESWPLARR
ncbi:hypothetical protein Nhal_4033 (plasmid) [Nitrosococcus halophilus Nc 4]|uniref:ORC1/DEAH AAA+ ATPase domain-containing protein n=1 Tax=Nitrosococcus halophilus (strain Nc4) TaxID=472759 RepID=D5C5I5_NITHN|nr:ATP-binding protein [Nitrosococcus halophilus]ADE17039.1 hypothetical protein Nhal_4033 [Nitrosococcus halophilus Nc 4]